MYVDGGFHGDGVYEKAEENDMEIHLTNMSGTQPSKNLPVSCFEINGATNLIEKCPGGHIPTRVGITKSQTTAHFPHTVCGNCEFKDQCFSKSQKKDCVVRISLKAMKVDYQREVMKADRKVNTSKRAGIEGTNSALKRTGLAKVRARGLVRSTMVCGLKVAAQNIKRFIKYMQGGYKPKNFNASPIGIPAPNFS